MADRKKQSLDHIPAKTFDQLLVQYLGQFGRFQWFLFVSFSFVAVGVTWHNLIHVFTGATPKFMCIASETFRVAGTALDQSWIEMIDDPTHTGISNLPNESISFDSTRIPYGYVGPNLLTAPPMLSVTPDWGNGSAEHVDTCSLTLNNITETCTEWRYDTSVYKSSIVTQWNLVCDRKWLASFAQALHMAGCMIGTLIFGVFSDRYGRRVTLLITSAFEITLGVSTAFVPLFELYALFRFFTGIVIAGQFNAAYVIALELVGPKWRGVAGAMMMFMSAVAIMTMSGLAYLVRDWKHLQLALSVPLVILLFYFVLAPESPRWLIAHNKMKGANALIKKMATFNGKKLPADYMDWITNEGETPRNIRRHSVVDIINSAAIRIRTVVLFFLWFCVSLTYYGLSLYTSNLGGNDYLNCFLSGIVEVPAHAFSIWCLSKFGRRIPVVSSMVSSGVFLILTSPFGDEKHVWRIVLSMIGKMCITVAYNIMYPFSAEMFPTVLRSNGLGIVSVGARVGGFVAPLILPLGDISKTIPLIICGGFAFLGGFLTLQLPETFRIELPESLEDAERMRNTSVLHLCRRCCRKGRTSSDDEKNPDKEECPLQELADEHLPGNEC